MLHVVHLANVVNFVVGEEGHDGGGEEDVLPEERIGFGKVCRGDCVLRVVAEGESLFCSPVFYARSPGHNIIMINTRLLHVKSTLQQQIRNPLNSAKSTLQFIFKEYNINWQHL
jgi:hypothetical protein